MSTLAILGGAPAVPPGEPPHPAYDREQQVELLAVAAGPLSDSGGPYSSWCRRLEGEVSALLDTGSAFVHSTPNATTGMRLGLRALGIGPGDEVIVPAYDWKSTAMVVCEIGAQPVFADIDPDTLHICPRDAAHLVGPRTRALVVSHVHGTVADMWPWLTLAEQYGIHLVEDPAQALGATWQAVPAGTIGTFGAYSLNWKKLTPSGDGGVFVTKRPDLYSAVRAACNFGEEEEPSTPDEVLSHLSSYLGGNERLNPLAAAVATVAVRHVRQLIANAEQIASTLAAISDLPGFALPQIPARSTSTHHLYRVLIDPEAVGWDGEPTELRDRIVAALHAEGLRPGYWGFHPVSDHPPFRSERPTVRTVDADPAEIRPVDLESVPVTRRMLDSSFVLGRAPYGLQHMTRATARAYVYGIEKVAANIEAVMTWKGYKPPTLHPPV